MQCVIYTRVSTRNQLLGKSLDAQEKICREWVCSHFPELKMEISVVAEAASAFRQLPPLLSKVNIVHGLFVCISVDRYSRNRELGYNFASQLASQGVVFIFVQDNLVISKNSLEKDIEEFKMKLYAAEQMSQILSRSVGNALHYRKTEQKLNDPKTEIIAEFVHLCRTVDTSAEQLNKSMLRLSSDAFTYPIELFFENVKVLRIREPLSYFEIANLLNAYHIAPENWNDRNVSKFYHENYRLPSPSASPELNPSQRTLKPMEIDG
jgi:DNA invertase Pin-like site-specific DNA recombinase